MLQRVLGLVLLSVVGCAAGEKTPPGRLRPSAEPIESDIPVPAGFSIVDRASEDFRSAGIRRLYLRHVYEGQADIHRIRAFYREQMPLARWSLVSDSDVRGEILMRFEKSPETCTINISRESRTFSQYARIQVIVAPTAAGQVPPTVRNNP